LNARDIQDRVDAVRVHSNLRGDHEASRSPRRLRTSAITVAVNQRGSTNVDQM